MPARGLTPKQRAFVDAYFAHGFNATRAAVAAGYSARTAAEIGYENLRKPQIRKAIDEKFAGLATDAELMLRLLVRELVSILSSDLAGLVEWDDSGMRLVPSADLTAEQAASLKEVSMVIHDYDYEHDRVLRSHRVMRSKVGQHDKVRAADLLARLHGLLRDKLEVSGSVGFTLERLIELAAQANDDRPDA